MTEGRVAGRGGVRRKKEGKKKFSLLHWAHLVGRGLKRCSFIVWPVQQVVWAGTITTHLPPRGCVSLPASLVFQCISWSSHSYCSLSWESKAWPHLWKRCLRCTGRWIQLAFPVMGTAILKISCQSPRSGTKRVSLWWQAGMGRNVPEKVGGWTAHAALATGPFSRCIRNISVGHTSNREDSSTPQGLCETRVGIFWYICINGKGSHNPHRLRADSGQGGYQRDLHRADRACSWFLLLTFLWAAAFCLPASFFLPLHN